jgi:hypothetical protein
LIETVGYDKARLLWGQFFVIEGRDAELGLRFLSSEVLVGFHSGKIGAFVSIAFLWRTDRTRVRLDKPEIQQITFYSFVNYLLV